MSDRSVIRARRLGAGVRLAVLGALALVLLAGCGGGGSSSGGERTTSLADLYRNELNPNPVKQQQVGMDPDQEPEGGLDTLTVVRPLGNGRYELRITNTTEIGYINSFTWTAPSQLRITKVDASSKGSCRLDNGAIVCERQAIPPPKCTCEPGGSITITFTATVPAKVQAAGVQTGVVGGTLRLGRMTPVPYLIPSYRGARGNIDLPLCARGQASTSDHPCVHTG